MTAIYLNLPDDSIYFSHSLSEGGAEAYDRLIGGHGIHSAGATQQRAWLSQRLQEQHLAKARKKLSELSRGLNHEQQVRLNEIDQDIAIAEKKAAIISEASDGIYYGLVNLVAQLGDFAAVRLKDRTATTQ